MKITRVRLAAAAFAALSLLAFGACSETDQTKTVQQLNPPLGDNEAFSALVVLNNNILHQSQIELTDGGVTGNGTPAPSAQGVDPDVISFAAQQATDHAATLNRLVGTDTIDYGDGGFAATGGLGQSAGLTLGTNRQTIIENQEGIADTQALFAGVGSTEPTDCAYLTDMVARHKEAGKLFAYYIADPNAGGNDGGATVTNSALLDELKQEQTTEASHLKKAKKLLAVLSAAPSTTPFADGGTDPGGPCYVPAP